jgi:hypothetical protein
VLCGVKDACWWDSFVSFSIGESHHQCISSDVVLAQDCLPAHFRPRASVCTVEYLEYTRQVTKA